MIFSGICPYDKTRISGSDSFVQDLKTKIWIWTPKIKSDNFFQDLKNKIWIWNSKIRSDSFFQDLKNKIWIWVSKIKSDSFFQDLNSEIKSDIWKPELRFTSPQSTGSCLENCALSLFLVKPDRLFFTVSGCMKTVRTAKATSYGRRLVEDTKQNDGSYKERRAKVVVKLLK